MKKIIIKMVITNSEMNLTTIETTAKKNKSSCYCSRKRILLIRRKCRKYLSSSNSSSSIFTTASTRKGFLRRSSKGNNGSHFFCKAVVLLVILEGLGRGSTEATVIAPVEGASSSNSWQSSQPHQQHSTFGFGGSGENDDSRGGGGTTGDSFINTFAGNRVEAARRMRDRCGRFSLLKVLQHWENLQRRCRLSVRNIFNANSTTSYQYDEEDPDRYNYMVAPPSPSDNSDSENDDDDDGSRIDKRSRHHYYSAISTLRVNNNDHDNEFRNYYYEVNGDALESCCPVAFEVIAPIYGRNRSGHMVELYKDENVQQKFNEYRCHKDYLEKPCRFVEGQYRRISKCVQQYLDTYALVRSDNSMTGWSMEHIRVASGCACKVDPASRRRKKVSSAQQQQRNQRRSQPYHDADLYKFGNTLLNKRNSKGRTFKQMLRYPGFSEY